MTDAVPAGGPPRGARASTRRPFADRVAEDRRARLGDGPTAGTSSTGPHHDITDPSPDPVGLGLAAAATFGVTSVVALLAIALAPTVFLGWAATVIESSSMQPTIERGDIVVLRPVEERLVGPGSVVQFPADDGGSSIVHRVVEVDTEAGAYVTKGDANPNDDRSLVPFDEIEGLGTILVPLIGHPALWFHEGRFLLLAVVMAAGLGVIWGGLGTGERRPGEAGGRDVTSEPIPLLAGPPLTGWRLRRDVDTGPFPQAIGGSPGRGRPRVA